MSNLQPLKVTAKSKPGKTGNFLRKYKLLFLLLVLVALGVFLFSRPSQSSVFNYVLGQNNVLKSENNRVNILLLGISGGTHDGPNLTDTIMVASYDLGTHNVHLISLPRDLWIDKYKEKVNSVYEIGLEKNNGLGLAAEEIGNVLGITIPYAVRLDFNGFVKAIDLVGGVDVDVVHSFDDFEYPIAGHESDLCGYQEKVIDISDQQSKDLGVPSGPHKALLAPNGKIATVSAQSTTSIDYTPEQIDSYFSCRFDNISFKQGPLHLDGVTALKFVRSRHGTNGEGSDFARSRRQQQVLQAFRNKILSLNTLSDPGKIVNLIQTFGASVETDIPQSQYIAFARLIKETTKVENFVIDSTGTNPLLTTPDSGDYGGAWVLVPAGGDYSRIHKFVADSLSDIDEASQSAKTLK